MATEWWGVDSEGVHLCPECIAGNDEFESWPRVKVTLDDEDWVYCESCGRAPSGRRSALLDPITWRGRISAWFRRRFGEGE